MPGFPGMQKVFSVGQLDLQGDNEKTSEWRSFPSRAEAKMQMSCGTVYDNTLKEGLATCKRLRENRTKWPHMYHRYHLTRGIDVTESDAIVVSARDQIQHTQNGCVRSSGGNVRYSYLDATRVHFKII